ncbi:MAG TPA: FAD-dependent oxidoreductase, partial [Rectinemataceae bacterium]|nr:FAD-dependent oxidoreductase [Rectinemataceae bacterium]
RNLFSSSTSRILAEASISHYETVADELELRPTGYLWTWSERAWRASEPALRRLAKEAGRVEILDPLELRRVLAIGPEDPRFEAPAMGVWGRRCGSLSAMGLAEHYARALTAAGGEIRTASLAGPPLADGSGSGGAPWASSRFTGLSDSRGETYSSGVLVAAAGCWLQDLLGPAGLATGVYPKKRQLFGLRVGDWGSIFTRGSTGEAPNLILPAGQVYLTPILSRGILVAGRADDLGRAFELPYEPASRAFAEEGFFRSAIEPVLRSYFPGLAKAYPSGLEIASSWAGHYDYYWPDRNPVVERSADLVWVGGSSGSGIMKADSIGRVAAAKAVGDEGVELADGTDFAVADLSLRKRRVAEEDLVI